MRKNNKSLADKILRALVIALVCAILLLGIVAKFLHQIKYH